VTSLLGQSVDRQREQQEIVARFESGMLRFEALDESQDEVPSNTQSLICYNFHTIFFFTFVGI
jgi:hypothetical protein